MKRSREVDKDEEIFNDQLDYIGYFFIKRVGFCLV
jgi:hypothetical protein